MRPLNLDPNANYPTRFEPGVDIPEWKKSISAGIKEAKAFGSGLAALGAQLTGFEGTRDRALENYLQNVEESQSGWRTPEVGRIEDIDLLKEGGLGRLGSYVSYQLPKGLMSLGSMLAGAGIGAAAAKMTAGTAAKQLAKEFIKDQAENLAAKEAGRLAAKAIARRTVTGAHIGALGGAFGLEAGQSYGQFATNPKIGPEKAAAPAVTYGTIAAGLEYVPFYLASRALGLGRNTLRTVIKSDPVLRNRALALGAGAAAGAASEGLTEGMQELVQSAVEKYAEGRPDWAARPKTPEEWSNFWNALAAGALVGGTVGGVVGMAAPQRAAARAPEPTHLSSYGDLVSATETPGVYVRENGTRIEDAYAMPLPPRGATPAAAPKVQPSEVWEQAAPPEIPAAARSEKVAPAAPAAAPEVAGAAEQSSFSPTKASTIAGAIQKVGEQAFEQQVNDEVATQVSEPVAVERVARRIMGIQPEAQAASAVQAAEVAPPEVQVAPEVRVAPPSRGHLVSDTNLPQGASLAQDANLAQGANLPQDANLPQAPAGVLSIQGLGAPLVAEGENVAVGQEATAPVNGEAAPASLSPEDQTKILRAADIIGDALPDAMYRRQDGTIVAVAKNLEGGNDYYAEWREGDVVPRVLAVGKNIPTDRIADGEYVQIPVTPNVLSAWPNAHHPLVQELRAARLDAEASTSEEAGDFVAEPDRNVELSPEDRRERSAAPRRRRTSMPTSRDEFLSATDAVLGREWTQRAVDAGLLVINESSLPEDASGTYDRVSGTITINLDHVPKGQSALDVLLHEVSHAGLARLLGGQFVEFHSDLETLAAQGSPTAQTALLQSTMGIVDALNRQRARNGDELIDSHLEDPNLPKAERARELQRVRNLLRKKNLDLLREEDMAYYVQLASSSKPAEQGYWRRLKNAIVAWFAQTGFGKALAALGWRPEMSPKLAVALAQRAAQRALARAELIEKLLGERARVLRHLPAGAVPGTIESFAGQKAVTADRSALEEAQHRVAAGDDPEVVRRDTGWFQGDDGKWRFEIDDSQAAILDPKAQTLGKFLDHPALFAAYPSLRQIPVERVDGPLSYYSPTQGKIGISRDYNDTAALNILLHEVQHVVQELESFAKGGNEDSEYVRQMSRGRLEEAITQYDYIKRRAKEKFHKATSHIDRAISEETKTLQRGRGYKVSMMQFWAKHPNLRKQYIAAQSEYDKTLLEAREVLIGIPYKVYRSLSGEVEARNTQTRQELTGEQRRAISPEQTRDTPLEDTIVVLESRPSYWRSAVAEAIANSPQSKAAPDQWLGWLLKQPYVKEEEIEDLDLKAWLSEHKGSVSKEELLEFVRAGRVELEEVLHGVPPEDVKKFQEYRAEIFDKMSKVAEDMVNIRDSIAAGRMPEEEGKKLLESLDRLFNTYWKEYHRPEMRDTSWTTQYDKFAIQGGSYYRELLLKIPGRTRYQSSHWTAPNVLLHIRFDEREGSDGSKVLLVQEVQSDWHQRGRTRGYNGGIDIAKAERINIAGEDVWIPVNDHGMPLLEYGYFSVKVKDEGQSEEEALEQLRNLQNSSGTILRPKGGGVPSAPLVSSWLLVGMKRIIHWAAKYGFSRVAWPATAQQLKAQGGWQDLRQTEDGTWLTARDSNVTSIVNRYTRELPKALERYGKRFGAKVELISVSDVEGPVYSIAITPKLRDEALAGQLMYSMPLRILDTSGWYTSPTSAILEERNNPGLFNKIFHSMVDAFQYVKNWDRSVYRRLDEMRNIIGARHDILRRELVNPIVSLLRAYTPTEEQLKIFRDMGLEDPNATQLRGHQLAALHVMLDGRAHGATNVNQYLARKAAPEALSKLRGLLPKADRAELDIHIAAHLPQGATDVKKLDPEIAYELFVNFYGRNRKWARFMEVGRLLQQSGLSNATKSALNAEYIALHKSSAIQLIEGILLMDHRGSGYSTALPGTEEYKRDMAEGFLNVHDLLRSDVLGDPNFQKLRELTQKAARFTLDTLQGDSPQKGIISPADAARLSQLYPNYVPLLRADFDFDYAMRKALERPREGMLGLLQREGSPHYASAANVIQNLLAQNYAAVTAVTRNEVINDFAAAVEANPTLWSDKFEVARGQRQYAADIAFTRYTASGKKQNLYLRPVASNLRAVATAAYLARLDAQQISGPLKIMRHVNNWIRWTAVSANPLFLMATAPRDYLTAVYNLQAGDAAKLSKKIASWKEYRAAFLALKQVVMDDKRTPFVGPNLTPEQVQHNENIELVEAMEAAGGKVSFVQSLRPHDNLTWQSLEQRVWRGHGKRRAVVEFAEKALDTIEGLNVVIENVMRLSTFKTMREEYQRQGMSKELATSKAAELARNLTTNFTRRGAHIDTINVWWLFYNATLQGNWQVIQNLFFNQNKKGAQRLMAAVGGTILFAFMLDQLGRALDDDWDEIEPWRKDRSILIPGTKVGGDYVSIPSPWVFNVFWRVGGMLSEVADGKRSLSDFGMDLAGLTVTTMDPIGGARATVGESTWLQAAAPSSFDWFAQIQENRDFVGNPLGPTGLGTKDRPDAYVAWDTTPKGYKHAAQFLNEITGGNVAESGWLDLRPSTLQVLTEFVLGGLGKFGVDVLETAGLVGEKNLFKREGPADLPLVKVFFTSPGDRAAVSLYHDRVARVLSTKRLMKEYSEGPNRNPILLAKVKRERAKMILMIPQAEDVERQITSLRKAIRTAQARQNSQVEKQLRERIVVLQKRFNQTFERQVGP